MRDCKSTVKTTMPKYLASTYAIVFQQNKFEYWSTTIFSQFSMELRLEIVMLVFMFLMIKFLFSTENIFAYPQSAVLQTFW